MNDNTGKTLVLQAIKAKNYKVKYKPSNSFFKCEPKKGPVYYVQWDMHRLGQIEDEGNITFIVQTDICHQFIYDWNEGIWSGDELCNEEEVIQALRALDEFIDIQDYPGYPEWQIYCKVNGINENIGYYWYEDDDCPGNIE